MTDSFDDGEEVIAFNHDVVLPHDTASGQATGKRQHKPLTITKELDKSTPFLMQSLINNEALTSFELRFYTSGKRTGIGSASGTEVNYFIIKLANAFIVDIKSTMPNNKNPESAQYEVFEEVCFIYEKIEWIWTSGTISTSDTV